MRKVFYYSSAILALAAGFIPAMLSAQTIDDELLRPMIVRPTAGSPEATSAGVVTQMAPPSPSASAMVNTPSLSLPSSSMSASGVDLGGRNLLSGTVARDMFANFGPPSGSAVSDRVFQLRDEAIGLREAVERNNAEYQDARSKGSAGAIQYHSTVAAITARLEQGTTRGNPVLLRQWSEAEQSLNEVNYSISRLNMLSANLSGNSSAAAYLLQSLRAAYELSGALDEDHDQLAMIRDEVAKTTVQVDRLRGEVFEDINRQNTYLGNERRNLQVLSVAVNRGELIRNSLASQPVVMGIDAGYGSLPNTSSNPYGFPTLGNNYGNSAAEPTNLLPAPPPAPVMPVQRAPVNLPVNNSALPMRSSSNDSEFQPTGQMLYTSNAPASASNTSMATMPNSAEALGQLLVLVRFNEPDVAYEQPLYQAVTTALDRKPDANFTVVAVTPKSNNVGTDTDMALRRADEVKNALVQLGLQPNHIGISSVSSEVAQNPEVHVYVR